jgi:RimJ/RimL family protein N-acetyltransferase
MSSGKRAIAPFGQGRVRLRLLEEADLPLTLRWRNQDHIRKWFFYSDPLSPEQHQAWFEQYRERDDDFVFVIEETRTLCRPVGQVSLYHIDWLAGRAEFGRLMIGDPAATRQGLACLATGLAVNEAFEAMDLREVYLELRGDNASALALYEASGFRVVYQHGDTVGMRKTRNRTNEC